MRLDGPESATNDCGLSGPAGDERTVGPPGVNEPFGVRNGSSSIKPDGVACAAVAINSAADCGR